MFNITSHQIHLIVNRIKILYIPDQNGCNVYTLLNLKWITSKILLYSTGNSVQCHVAAWMRGKFGKEWIHVYVWLSSFVVCLK